MKPGVWQHADWQRTHGQVLAERRRLRPLALEDRKLWPKVRALEAALHGWAVDDEAVCRWLLGEAVDL